MLRTAVVGLLHDGCGCHAALSSLLGTARAEQLHAARAFASRRQQPSWATNKPRTKKEEREMAARVKKLLRAINGDSAAGPSLSAPSTSAAPSSASAASKGVGQAAASAHADSSGPAEAPSASGSETSSSETSSSETSSSETSSSGPSSSPPSASSSGGGEAGAAAASAPSTSAAQQQQPSRTWVPSFLRGLIPGTTARSGSGSGDASGPRRVSPLMQRAVAAEGGRDLAEQAAAAAAAQEQQLAERAAAQEAFVSKKKKRSKDGEDAPDPWENIKMMKDLTVDEYLQQVRSWKGTDPPPRPQPPKRYKGDAQRIEYMRWSQHEAIVQLMTDEEKALVRLDPAAATANRPLLEALSLRSGYGFSQVRDVITCYRDVRDRINALALWRGSGRPMPEMNDMDGKLRVIEAVKEERRRAEMDTVLARRDRANCPVRPYIRLLGRRAECPNTKLPYTMCCGAKDKGKAVASATA